MKVSSVFLFAILGATVSLSRAGVGQAAPAAQADNPMTLDVVVTDKADRPVAGLAMGDFKVMLDNKNQRDIVSVKMVSGQDDRADPPVEAILLVDMINVPFETLSNERKDLIKYLQRMGTRLSVPTRFVFLTETELRYQGEATRDPKILLQNLENNPSLQRLTQPQGGYQQYAQMREKSLQALNELAVKMSGEPGRKLVVWISPGWASFSKVSDQKSPKELEMLFTFIAGISAELRAARITLYNVDTLGVPGDLAATEIGYYKEFLKGVSKPSQANNGDLGLQVIAAQTGGKVLYGANDMGKMVDQCLADSQAFYVVTFNAPKATQANEYHAIQVQVNKPGMKARTSMGYYAQPQ
jgi:VWFA-related protein